LSFLLGLSGIPPLFYCLAIPPRHSAGAAAIPPGAAVNPAFKLSSPPGEGWDVFSARHHLPFLLFVRMQQPAILRYTWEHEAPLI